MTSRPPVTSVVRQVRPTPATAGGAGKPQGGQGASTGNVGGSKTK
jgi:hypothetical protein